MANKNLYLDLNVIQTVPSSNINRDDTGAPKTAIYGGVTRARVSSQAWKQAIRHSFKESGVKRGSRTREAAKLLTEKIMELDASLDQDAANEKSHQIFIAAGITFDKKETNKTRALLFVSPGQIEKLAQFAVSHDDLDVSKKNKAMPEKVKKELKRDVKKAINNENTLDLALFGRMVADNPELNVEGTAQVAHAISTHEIVPEFDYYTALDDLKGDDTNGAGFIGTSEFNSSTLYRYANINVRELAGNLGDDNAITGAADFIKSFILSMPTGKENSYANKTLPNYVLITVRTDTPVNLVSAFEEPVQSKDGYLKNSVKKLEDEYQSTLRFVLDQPIETIALSESKTESEIENQATNLPDLIDQVTEVLEKAVQDENTND